MSHSHRCDYPGCKAWVDCNGRPVIDSIEDGIKHGHYDCADHGPFEHLCERHHDAKPCADCGDYGHPAENCTEN